MGACSNAFYWLRTGYGSSAAYYVDNKGKVDWNYGYTGSGVRPACYLDLSDLFFASGDSGMGDSVGAFPSKLEAPLYDTIQRYNFVMHDDTLSLSMVGAATQTVFEHGRSSYAKKRKQSDLPLRRRPR